MMQDGELLFEVVRGGTLYKDVIKLYELGKVAGLQVGLIPKDGKHFLSIRYDDEYTEFKRNRNAGRPRTRRQTHLTCGEVDFLKETEGAEAAAVALGMPIATFYRRYKESKGKKGEEYFM